MATVRAIARKPIAFLGNLGTYDPEAAAKVYGAYGSVSLENRLRLSQFEAGLGPAPPAEEIAAAAARVLCYLEAETQKDSHVGGQTLELRNELVLDLATIFKNFGGRTTRVTRFDPDRVPAHFEDGPFHGFLEIVIPAARPFAKRAGFRMQSLPSLVAIVRKSKGQKSSRSRTRR
jgi:hypothetical protein